MLFRETIDGKTLGLLKRLQSAPEFTGLRLLGGTALALQIGHRRSDDIDLFGPVEADPIAVRNRLRKLGPTTVLSQKKFPDGSSFLVLRSLVYFDDAEEEPPPQMLHERPWSAVKETIVDAVRPLAP